MPEGFNEYFLTIASKLVENIPSPDGSSLEFLSKPTTKDIGILMTTKSAEVKNIIKSLNAVGGGVDKTGTKIMVSTYQGILRHLPFFFDLCLSNAVFSDLLKVAIIKPIYETGHRYWFSNYRSMSLIPIFSKILEKLLHSQLSSYFEESNILNELQFGFRKNHGTIASKIRLTRVF